MRDRRRLAAAFVAVAALVSVAADGDTARPVIGGGSFNEPPLLGVGDWRDTIGADESLFYRVDVASSSTIEVEASIEVDDADVDGGLALQAFTRERAPLGDPVRVEAADVADVASSLQVAPRAAEQDGPVTVAVTWFTEDGREAAARLHLVLDVGVADPTLERAGPAGPPARRRAAASADDVGTVPAQLAPAPALGRVGLGVVLGVGAGAVVWRWREALSLLARRLDEATS